MSTYKVEFHLQGEAYEFSMVSPNLLDLQSDDETLKEEAATIIRTFHTHYPKIKKNVPTDIKMYKDSTLILDCVDLSEKSINHAKY